MMLMQITIFILVSLVTVFVRILVTTIGHCYVYSLCLGNGI